MNGCRYCVIVHNRRHRRIRPKIGQRSLVRGRAMCLAGETMMPCEAGVSQRGTQCVVYQKKIAAVSDDNSARVDSKHNGSSGL